MWPSMILPYGPCSSLSDRKCLTLYQAGRQIRSGINKIGMPVDVNAFYSANIAFFSGSRKEHAQDEFVREHVLTYIIAGELRFTEADKDTIARPGDAILFRRNLLVKCEKRPLPDGQPFKVVHFVLEQQFLEQYALTHNLPRTTIPADHKPVLYVRPQPPLMGLLHSMHPYMDAGMPLSKEMMLHKLIEAVMALLEQQQGLDQWLFGFPQQGKMDLEDFMQRNFMFNVPTTKLAELTGRSLSTFQRDFRKLFGTNASAWLLKRRLQAAYEAIAHQHKMPVDIYLDLGFEDISHFSRSFKQEFGYSPSQLKPSTFSLPQRPLVSGTAVAAASSARDSAGKN
jgi:AraC-like DNA-binding protein